MQNKESQKLAIHGGVPLRSRPWPPRHLFGEEEKQAAIRLFDQAIASGEAFSYNGAEETAYCQEFAQTLGGGFADAVSSGTSAVYVALRALNLEPFTEIIVPPVSDPGGFMPVPLMNCIPIPSDAAPGSYNAGPDQVAERISERTSAIIVAHIAGQPADMDPILEIAHSRGIAVIEDCAQAHGALYKSRPVGTLGDISAFSTMSGKHHATAAQGGVVFTKRETLYWNARRAADRGKPFGLPTATKNVTASLNYNSNELAAAVGRVQLRKLPRIVAARRKFAASLAERMAGLRSLTFVPEPAEKQGSYWFATLKFNEQVVTAGKAEFCKALAAEGLLIRDTYLHTLIGADWYMNRAVFGSSGLPWSSPLYTGDKHAKYQLPNVEATDATHVNLLMHEGFGAQEAADIANAILKVESAFLK